MVSKHFASSIEMLRLDSSMLIDVRRQRDTMKYYFNLYTSWQKAVTLHHRYPTVLSHQAFIDRKVFENILDFDTVMMTQ